MLGSIGVLHLLQVGLLLQDQREVIMACQIVLVFGHLEVIF
jgi:hypothetical protein